MARKQQVVPADPYHQPDRTDLDARAVDLPHDLVLPAPTKRGKPEVVAPGPIKPFRSVSVAVIRTIKQRPLAPGGAGGFELQIEKLWVVDGNGDLWFKIGEDPWVFFL